MLDIKFIRDNLDIVKAGGLKKHVDVDLDALVAFDDERRGLLASIEAKRASQNLVSDRITSTPEADREKLFEEMRVLKTALQEEEERFKEVMGAWQKLMLQVPNVPDVSVPEGESDQENMEVRVWGVTPTFAFTPKNHLDLARDLGLADFERGAKVAGFRGYFLTGMGARLMFALQRAVENHWLEKGFSPMVVPSLVRREAFLGTGYLPQGEDDLYKTQDGEFLSGTGEVAAMAFHMDETLERRALPERTLAVSPCFRREAGSHSKDTKGLIRVHEFFKYEQVVLCEANHQTTVELHEEITNNATEFLEKLGLPYRVVLNCGGDLGLGQVKKYDIEAWVPSQDTYRETHSASYFHDFQTRRLNIRYRAEDGSMKFAHSLNNTALAFPRILVPLLEIYQQEDGSVRVPELLREFVGTDVITAPKQV